MASKGHKAQSSWTYLFSSPTAVPQYSEVSQQHHESHSSAGSFSRPWRGRSRLAAVCIGICIVVVSTAGLLGGLRPRALAPVAQDALLVPEELDDGRELYRYVNGPPTPRVRDNLRHDVKYITSFASAGWTNDVMALVNMIYLAILTERVPVLPAFVPTHLAWEAGPIDFGDIYDLPSLSAAIHIPILQWRDLKDYSNSTETETLGCWSVWMGSSVENTRPRGSHSPPVLKLDLSYTPVPYAYKVYGEGDFHILLNRLMQLSFPSGRGAALAEVRPQPSTELGAVVDPDDHLQCFDYLYYTSVDKNFEWEVDWSPVWRLVGRHMKWSPQVERVANDYLKRHFGVSESGPVPPYISVHARRGDFGNNCPECLPSYEQIGERIREMQHALQARHGVSTDRVLIASDETDPAWWDGVRQRGWTWIDHVAERTDERYGKWYTPVLDAVFLSFGSAFIGTHSSTYSLVAERRVQDWNDGPTTRLWWKGL